MNSMNRRHFLQFTALATSVACFGDRPAGLAFGGNSTATELRSANGPTPRPGAQFSAKWQRIGPDFEPTKGVCYHVLPHPHRQGELLVGARPQGLLLSTDHGRTWQHTSERFSEDGHIGPNPESMDRAPSRPDTVYAGIESLGVRRSDDGGKTWRDLSASLPKGGMHNGVCVAIHPTDPETAWLGTDGGIFKTNDGGKNWQRLKQGLPTGETKSSKGVTQTITKIFVNGQNPDQVWLGMYASGFNQPAGVWRSVDGGQTWLPSSDGMDSGDQLSGSITCRRDWVMGLARSSSQPEVFFAITPFAVYRSDNGAKKWRKLSHVMGGHALAVHPRDVNQVFLAARDGRVEHSTDGGETWRDISTGLRLGREPNAPVIKFNLTGPDGRTQAVEGTDRRFENQVVSFAFNPLDPDAVYACAHAGLYQLRISSLKNR